MVKKGDALPTNPDAFTAARRAQFLLALVETGSIRGAAARTNVSRQTVYVTAEKDESFRDQIVAARGEWEQSLVEVVMKGATEGEVITRRGKTTAKPGDWRAAAWLLEHAPSTREAYAGILRQKVEMGGAEDLPPIQTQTTVQHEIGPDTMERLSKVVMVLIQSGKLRLPDPGEVDGEVVDGNPA